MRNQRTPEPNRVVRIRISLFILGTASVASPLNAADWVQPVEIQTRDHWAKWNLRDPKGKLAFSFVRDEARNLRITAGQELLQKGLTVENKDKPGTAVITYKRRK